MSVLKCRWCEGRAVTEDGVCAECDRKYPDALPKPRHSGDATVKPEDPPVPMLLECPMCGLRHYDRGEWKLRPHKTHLCEYCGVEWKPWPFATVGV